MVRWIAFAAVPLLAVPLLAVPAWSVSFRSAPSGGGSEVSILERGKCAYFDFTAPALAGPIEVHGGSVWFDLDGDLATSATTGATAYVYGCTTFSSDRQSCSCDLAGGDTTCAIYDGTPGKTGFLVMAPRSISVQALTGTGRAAVCTW